MLNGPSYRCFVLTCVCYLKAADLRRLAFVDATGSRRQSIIFALMQRADVCLGTAPFFWTGNIRNTFGRVSLASADVLPYSPLLAPFVSIIGR